MYKQRFSLGDLVVVKVRDVKKFGVLISRSVKRGTRVFDVKLESGTILPSVRVDDEKDSTYIDSAATLTTFKTNLVSTNLSTTTDNLKAV